jgi:hypothetical protein
MFIYYVPLPQPCKYGNHELRKLHHFIVFKNSICYVKKMARPMVFFQFCDVKKLTNFPSTPPKKIKTLVEFTLAKKEEEISKKILNFLY